MSDLLAVLLQVLSAIFNQKIIFVKEESTSVIRCAPAMKKFLSLTLAIVFVFAVASVAAFAATPTAADFSANNGFFIYVNSSTPTEVQDVPEVSDSANGVRVAHGGWFTSADNCGGVYTNEKYDLNGLSVTVFFEKIPEETVTTTDCWVSIDFLAAPGPFTTGNFNVANGGNQGIMNLIRFGRSDFELRDGIESFGGTWDTSALDASEKAMFALKSGDSITVKVNRTGELGEYTLTCSRDGFADFVIPYEIPAHKALADGKAHISVIASSEIAQDDGFVYYITDITNGASLTADEKEAIDSAIAAIEFEELKVEYITPETGKFALAEASVADSVAKANESGVEAAIIKAEEAEAKLAEAKAAFEAKDLATVDAAISNIEDLAVEIKREIRNAEDDTPKADGTNTENDKGEVPADSNVSNVTDNGGISPVIWVVIAVVVVAAIVAVVLVSKKKKN